MNEAELYTAVGLYLALRVAFVSTFIALTVLALRGSSVGVARRLARFARTRSSGGRRGVAVHR